MGEVNDGNTYYALDGVSSHAGLFSTAADLERFANMYVTGGVGVLSPATIARATAVQTDGLGASRGLGWDLAPGNRQPRAAAISPSAARKAQGTAPSRTAGGWSFGDLLFDRTYGHTAFTGTSMAIDPERELVLILLTNRTHPDATNNAISTVRPRFRNMVAASLQPD